MKDNRESGVDLCHTRDGSLVRTFPVHSDDADSRMRARIQVAIVADNLIVAGTDHGKVLVFHRTLPGRYDTLHHSSDPHEMVQTVAVRMSLVSIE